MPTPPNESFWNWLGRQVGHVRKAVQTDVDKALPAQQGQVVYRQGRVQEQPMPSDPTLKLRRTTIDEVIAEPKAPPAGGTKPGKS
jgi:hypothetical protein